VGSNPSGGSTKYITRDRIEVMSKCLECDTQLKPKDQVRFCSNKCQKKHEYFEYINKWKIASESGEKFIKTRNISKYIRRYLEEQSEIIVS
jgi:hypothetical protein